MYHPKKLAWRDDLVNCSCCWALLCTLIVMFIIGFGYQLWPLLVIFLVWVLPLMYVKIMGWRRSSLDPMRIGFALAAFLSWIVCLWYFGLANAAGQGSWFYVSPCGQSACSHQKYQSVIPFNPTGFFPDAWGLNNVLSLVYVSCVCTTCNWADDNGQGRIIGFGTGFVFNGSDPLPSGGLASPVQYPNPLQPNMPAYPNPAYGLPLGYSATATVNDQALCFGHGQPICPRCLQYMRNTQGYSDPATDYWCPSSLYSAEDDGACWLCPAPMKCGNLATIAYAFLSEGAVLFFLGLMSWCLVTQ